MRCGRVLGLLVAFGEAPATTARELLLGLF
jgi:hypothetical protein